MIDDTWVNETTSIQVLLDAEAGISNVLSRYKLVNDASSDLKVIRTTLHRQIECLRGPAPGCYGQDDCSTHILSICPWRMTCGQDT
jgi:hypothetical protein